METTNESLALGEVEHTNKWTHTFLWCPKREVKLGKESLGRLHGDLTDAVPQGYSVS